MRLEGRGGGDTCSSVSTKIMFRETFSGFRLRVSCGLKWAGPMASLGRSSFLGARVARQRALFDCLLSLFVPTRFASFHGLSGK